MVSRVTFASLILISIFIFAKLAVGPTSAPSHRNVNDIVRANIQADQEKNLAVLKQFSNGDSTHFHDFPGMIHVATETIKHLQGIFDSLDESELEVDWIFFSYVVFWMTDLDYSLNLVSLISMQFPNFEDLAGAKMLTQNLTIPGIRDFIIRKQEHIYRLEEMLNLRGNLLKAYNLVKQILEEMQNILKKNTEENISVATAENPEENMSVAAAENPEENMSVAAADDTEEYTSVAAAGNTEEDVSIDAATEAICKEIFYNLTIK